MSDSQLPRAYWWCDDCRLGSSWWYKINSPIWNCPKCKKEYKPRKIEGGDNE
jgi:Zn finger protein HypA/HybF involved in hydrogenase expression